MEGFIQGKVQYARLGFSSEKKVLSSVVVCGVSQLLNVLTFMVGVEMGDGSDSSWDWGLRFSSFWVVSCWTNVIAARILNGFGGMLWSFRLGGTIGCCAPNPYGNFGSFESSSRVTMSGSGDATEEIVGISPAWVPDSSVELRIFGSCFIAGWACSRVAPRRIHRSPVNPLKNWRPYWSFKFETK